MGLGLLLSALCIGYPLIFMPSYISESTPFPKPLTKAEETRLLDILCQDGSADADKKAAKEKLVSHNMRLAAHVAKKYSNTGIDQDDLISIGSVGLIKAIDNYSPDRSTRLGTYAARCIENAIHPKKEKPQGDLVHPAACTLFTKCFSGRFYWNQAQR